MLQYLKNTQDFFSEEDYFCAHTFRTAVRFLEDNVDRKPFFLWVDTFDPHEPFDCPREYALKYYDKYPCERYIFSYGADHRNATEHREPVPEDQIDEDSMPPDLITALLEPLLPPRLYDLKADFDETQNVIDEHPDVAQRHRKWALEKWLSAPI